GCYVVEVAAEGIAVRTLLTIGTLSLVSQICHLGVLCKVIDTETGDVVPDAVLQIGTNTYTALSDDTETDAEGEGEGEGESDSQASIIVPFRKMGDGLSSQQRVVVSVPNPRTRASAQGEGEGEGESTVENGTLDGEADSDCMYSVTAHIQLPQASLSLATDWVIDRESCVQAGQGRITCRSRLSVADSGEHWLLDMANHYVSGCITVHCQTGQGAPVTTLY
ncbi:hypothetical protein KIPB_012111, partial [Kipferlia bialata]